MMYPQTVQASNYTDIWNDSRKPRDKMEHENITLSHLPQPLNPAALSNIPNGNRDTEWLRVEVCREFLRGSCKRTEVQNDCKFAHPQHKGINVENGKVVACFDSLKGKCHRDYCKYLHPPPHIKSQLEINGRNAQILRKNLQPTTGSSMVVNPFQKADIGVFQPGALQPVMSVQPQLLLINPGDQTQTIAGNGINRLRPDRLEVCRDFMRANCERGNEVCKYAHPPVENLTVGDQTMIDTTDNTVIVCMDAVKGRCSRQTCKYFHPPAHLITEIKHRQSLISQQTEMRTLATASNFETKPILTSTSPLTGYPMQQSLSQNNIKFDQYKYDYGQQTQQPRRASMGYDTRCGPPTSPSPGPVYPQSSIATVPLMYNFSNVGFSHNVYNASNMSLQGSMGTTQQWAGSQTTPAAINPMTMTIGTWSAETDGQIRVDSSNQVYQQNKFTQPQQRGW